MATQPSILAWEMPWTEELGGLQSMGRQRARRDLATKQQMITYVHDWSPHCSPCMQMLEETQT